MCEYKIMAYNIENMRGIFSNGHIDDEFKKRSEAIAYTIKRENPHILGLVEASDKISHHQEFINSTCLKEMGFQIGKSQIKRGKQDLVFYYREPFELLELDKNHEFYHPWIEDIDKDGIKELCEFERPPLEGLFSIKGRATNFTVILVAAKSKGVFAVKDLISHQYLGLGNRKKLYAQAKKIRERADCLLQESKDSRFIIMGDVNDEPGMDAMQKIIGASAIETIMGSVFNPRNILHNALWHMQESTNLKNQLWTTKYPDMIVQNFKEHRAWLDHIFVSPGFLQDQEFFYLKNSGNVGIKDEISEKASDHFPVYGKFKLNI